MPTWRIFSPPRKRGTEASLRHEHASGKMGRGAPHFNELQQLNRSLKRGRLPLVRAYVREGLPEWFDTHLTMMDSALVAFLKKQRAE